MRIANKVGVLCLFLCSLPLVEAATVDLGGQATNAKVNINGTILNTQTCQLTVAQPNKEYTIKQNRVPNYGYYFEQAQRVKSWPDRGSISDYDAARNEFNFTFSCNYKATNYRLKLDASQAVTPSVSNNAYNYLLLPEGASAQLGQQLGFVLMTDKLTPIINVQSLATAGGADLGTFGSTQCGVNGVRVGEAGYCTMSFSMAAVLVGANTSQPLDTTSAFVPQSWVTKPSYTLNLSVSVDFQ